MGFFLQMQGQFGTFLYTDPTDSTATNATFADWRWGDHDLHLLAALWALSSSRLAG